MGLLSLTQYFFSTQHLWNIGKLRNRRNLGSWAGFSLWTWTLTVKKLRDRYYSQHIKTSNLNIVNTQNVNIKNVNNKMSKQKWSTFKKSQIKISQIIKNVKAIFAMVNF